MIFATFLVLIGADCSLLEKHDLGKIRHNTQIHRQNYNSAITASPRDDVTVNGLQFFFCRRKGANWEEELNHPERVEYFVIIQCFTSNVSKSMLEKKDMDSNFRLIREFDFKYRLANDLYFLCGYTLVEQA